VTTPFVLGLDLDGVCSDYEGGFRDHCVSLTGKPASEFGPQTHWSFQTSGWVETEREFYDLHARAVGRGLFADMAAIDGVSKHLWALSDADVHIRIITHRLCINGSHGRAASDTVAWLEKHNIPYRDLCFVADKSKVGADVYIDDAPHNVAALRAAGGYTIVFDTLYNRDVDGPRAHSWAEVAELVLARKAALGR